MPRYLWQVRSQRNACNARQESSQQWDGARDDWVDTDANLCLSSLMFVVGAGEMLFFLPRAMDNTDGGSGG
jgi:hypothetical protein